MIEISKTRMLTIERLHIHGCKEDGAIHLTHTTATIRGVIFTNNTAKFGGALTVIKSEININNSTFKSNSATQDGGAIQVSETNVSLSGCSFINNHAHNRGGAINIANGSRHRHLFSSKNTYISNRAGIGGAVRSCEVNVRFHGDTFHDNQASKQGAAIYTLTIDSIKIQHCSFTWNRAKNGKGAVVHIAQAKLLFMNNSWLHNNGFLYLLFSQVSFKGNTQFSSNYGGAIVSIVSKITVEEESEILISENRGTYGGGICLRQNIINIQTNGMKIVRNVAEKSGGGIYAFQSTLNIRSNVQVVHNVTTRNGGGIYLSKSTIHISGTGKSAFFINNRAQQFGGGIFLKSTSNIQIKDETVPSKELILNFTKNSAKKGGGIYVEDNSKQLCKGMLANPCFLQAWLFNPTRNSRIQFAKNTAKHTGSDIYGGLLDRCSSSISEYTATKWSGIEYIQKKVKFDWARFEIDNTNIIKCSCECDRKLASFVRSCYPGNGAIELNSNVWIEYVNSTNITDYVIHACPFDYCVEKPTTSV